MKECGDCGEEFTGAEAICDGCTLLNETPCESCGKLDRKHDMRCGWTRQDFEDERGDYLYDQRKEEGRL